MTNTWTAYIQINGEETSDYYINDFEITETQYNALTDAVKNNVKIKSLDFYSELLELAEDTINWEELYLDVDWKPCKEDFYVSREELEEIPKELEDDEEYCAELVFDQEAYDEELESWRSSVDEYCIAAIDIYDPGDLARFKERFIGRELEDDEVFDIDETDERIVYYHVNVNVEDGLIVDLDIEADALESDGVKGGSLGECYPDYEFLADELEEILSSHED